MPFAKWRPFCLGLGVLRGFTVVVQEQTQPPSSPPPPPPSDALDFQTYFLYDLLFERLLDLNQCRPSLLAHIYVILSRWYQLTHILLDKIAAILQTTYSKTFFWMKLFQFQIKFRWKMFLGVQLIICSDNGLAPSRRQVIIWTNADPVHRRIYAALGGDELKKLSWSKECRACMYNEKITGLNACILTCTWYTGNIDTKIPGT